MSGGSFTTEGEREITYGIDPSRWGEVLATAALDEFVQIELTRPLLSRVAEHNIGSAKWMERIFRLGKWSSGLTCRGADKAAVHILKAPATADSHRWPAEQT